MNNISKNKYLILLTLIVVISFAIILTQNNVWIQTGPVYKEPTYLSIREIDVKPVEVTSSFADINITAYINYRGSETENASMTIRAIDSSTKLLDSQVSATIPETNEETTEKTMKLSQNLKVDKNADYDLKILLFNNGSVLDSGSVSISGINLLIPESKNYPVNMKNMDFIIGGVSAGRVTIKPNIYLENTGESSSENLKILVKAREADSNILADRTSTETGAIDSEKTVIKEVQLNVPDGYNYMIVAELWKNDTLINSWERPILLAPTKTIPKESQEKKVKIEVGQFVREGGQPPIAGAVPAAIGTEAAPAATQTPKEPGFEMIGAIITILLVLIYRNRRS